jgi:hypothetical protein
MASDNTEVKVLSNTEAHRFEAKVSGIQAFLQYSLSGNSIVFTHTEVPTEIEGRGIGSSLAKAGLDYARRHGLTVVPRCPFVEGYIRKHPEELELVDPALRDEVFSDLS